MQDCSISLCIISQRLGMANEKRSDFNLKICLKITTVLHEIILGDEIQSDCL